MKISFFILVGLIVYVYLGYHLLLIVVSRFKREELPKDEGYWPSVSLVIAAYNEERVIEDKLDNSLALDYPAGKLEIIVISDGSTDRTVELVKQYVKRGIIFKRLDVRRGKTAAQNEGVALARNDVIVFSDANGIYQRDAIGKLVRNLAHVDVGAVCGRLKYLNPWGDPSGESEILYWQHENFIKAKESLISSIVGANGSIYALRRELYVPLDEDLMSDLVEPIKIVERGLRVVYEPEAVSTETTSSDLREEFRRKVRIVARGFGSLRALWVVLNPFRFGIFSIELISHKILRWVAPWLLIAFFIINIPLTSDGFS